MKNLIFLTLPFIFICCISNTTIKEKYHSPIVTQVMQVDSHFNVVIGTASGSVYTITYNKTLMKTQWESFIGAGAPNLNVDSFSIKYDSLYYLVGKSINGDSKCAIQLELDGGNFYIVNVSGMSSTCTCKSDCCTYGCSPKKLKGEWYCNVCTFPVGCTNCSKTETSGAGGIFY